MGQASGRADRLHPESGLALVPLIMILGALTILSIGLILFSSTEVQIADNYRNHTGALYVAEAGVAEVLSRMNWDAGDSVTVNGSTFDPHIGDDLINPDPDWRTEVYLSAPSSLPTPTGSEIVVATVQPSSSWLDYGDPGRGLDPITVEHKWIDRDGDGVREADELVRYDPTRVPSENFRSGGLVEVITVPARHNASRRTIRTEVTKVPIIPRVPAAVTADVKVEYKATDGPYICGHVHDPNTPPGIRPPDCKIWELCNDRTDDLATGCLFTTVTSGDEVKTKEKNLNTGDPWLDKKGLPEKKQVVVNGFPSWADTSSYNLFLDVKDCLGISKAEWDTVRARADWTSKEMKDVSGFDGVVFVDDPADTSKMVDFKLENSDGQGLLYVHGKFHMKKSTWRGLIFAEGDVDIGSQSWILGALVGRGQDKVKGGKKSTILYCPMAIERYIRRDYITLAWKEL